MNNETMRLPRPASSDRDDARAGTLTSAEVQPHTACHLVDQSFEYMDGADFRSPSFATSFLRSNSVTS